MERALETLAWYCLNSGDPSRYAMFMRESLWVDLLPFLVQLPRFGQSLTIDVQSVYIYLCGGHQSCFIQSRRTRIAWLSSPIDIGTFVLEDPTGTLFLRRTWFAVGNEGL